MTRLLLVSEDAELIGRLRTIAERGGAQLIALEPPDAEGEQGLLGRIIAQRPNMVVVGPQVSSDLRGDLTREIDTDYPGLVVVWLTEELPEVLRLAMLTGARDVIGPETPDNEMLTRLVAAGEIGEFDRGRAGADGVAKRHAGRLVAVVGTVIDVVGAIQPGKELQQEAGFHRRSA